MAKKKIKVVRKKDKKQNKQLKIIVIVLAVVLAAMFLTYWGIQGSKKFDFLGLGFEKTADGSLTYYTSQVQVTTPAGDVLNYNLKLRNDPRTLDMPNDTIKYLANSQTYVSIDPAIGRCEDGGMAFTNIGMFLRGLGIDVKGAFSDADMANQTNMPYITCENTKNNTVLLFEPGNITGITKQGECYIVNVNNCEVVRATEDVMIGTIATIRGYIK